MTWTVNQGTAVIDQSHPINTCIFTGAVRAAATICLQTWLKDSNMDYGGLVNDKGVELGKPLHANKQIGMEIFDLTEEARILCGAGVDAAPSSTESRLKSPNENNLPHA